MKRIAIAACMCMPVITGICQDTDSTKRIIHKLDSITISQTENKKLPFKNLHAEPLYIDLIRDLGARKAEKEWNLGFGMTDNLRYDQVDMLVEYEFAPIDRLGFEIELPFTFYSRQNGLHRDSISAGGLQSLKLATQWSFLVSEKLKTSFAGGYIHEFTVPGFRSFGKPLLNGNVFNPFLVAARRWGQHFHTLLYTGPRIEKPGKGHTEFIYDVNTSFHYMIPGTRNFIGIEFNKNFYHADYDMVIRPQMRLGIAENLLLGIVSGIPVKRENQRFSMFTRLIWEPSHKKK